MKWLISVAVAVAMVLGGVAMASPALALELPQPPGRPDLEDIVPAELPDFALPDQCARDNAPVFQDDSVIHDPVVDDPVIHDPVVDDPVVDDPVVHDPVVDEPVAHEPVADDAVAESSESAQVESAAAVNDAVMTAS